MPHLLLNVNQRLSLLLWNTSTAITMIIIIAVFFCFVFFILYNIIYIIILAGHPLRGWPARLRGHKGFGLWKVWTVPSPPLLSPPLPSPPLPSPSLPCPALPSPPLPSPPLPSPPSLPPSLPRAKFDQAESSRLAEARECGAALAISERTL